MKNNKTEKIKIGKIVNAVGLKGEVKVYNYSDSSDIYGQLKAIYDEEVLREVKGVREQKNTVILSLEGIETRDEAEMAKGRELYITENDLPKLPQGQYYVRDLIGMEVVLEDGSHLGEITHVIQNTAQDVFEVETAEGKKVLIPRVPEFVLDIDETERVITVHLIEGMLEL
ncbi:MAG: ribosome maturation factor RimM [Eubacteriales bacterium]|nr:ribosome maturation factor RimM [Eubacteriales bacterium]